MPTAKSAAVKDQGSKVQLPPASNPLNIKSVYSNNMQLTVSSLDARLLFNEIVAEGGPLTVERRANIVMSIPHLRAMVQVLNAHIKRLDELAATPEGQPPIQK